MDHSSSHTLWRDNHGNFLLAVAILVVVSGAVVMMVRARSAARREQLALSRPAFVPPPAANESTPELPPDLRDGAASSEGGAPTEVTGTSLLRIRIQGLDHDQGKVRIALFTDARFFTDAQFAESKTTVNISDLAAIWDVEIPAGRPVAIYAFHDENSNGELDRNLFGMPIEEYGYSLGARAPRGPPPFEETAFEPAAGVIDVPVEIW